MIELKRSKRNRSKYALFYPYRNGISSYDMTYLSSRKSVFKNKTMNLQSNTQKEYLAP